MYFSLEDSQGPEGSLRSEALVTSSLSCSPPEAGYLAHSWFLVHVGRNAFLELSTLSVQVMPERGHVPSKASEFPRGVHAGGHGKPPTNSKKGIFFLKSILGRVYREMLGN